MNAKKIKRLEVIFHRHNFKYYFINKSQENNLTQKIRKSLKYKTRKMMEYTCSD